MAATSIVAGQIRAKRKGSVERAPLSLENLEKFVDPLPIAALARASGKRPDPEHPGHLLPFYRMAMSPMVQKVHRDVPPTRCWGFRGGSPGPTIETRSDEGLLVEWANNLPTEHFLPIDHNVHGAEKD
jgi:spore coat protein A